MCKNNNNIIIIRNHLPLWQRQGGKALGEDHKVGEARAVQPVLLAASMGARRGLPGQGQGPGGQIGEGREEGGGLIIPRARARTGQGQRWAAAQGMTGRRGGAGASRGRGEPQQRRGPDGGRPEVGAVGAWLPVSGLERGQGGDRAGIRWGGDRRTGVEPGAELEGRAYSLGAALPPPPLLPGSNKSHGGGEVAGTTPPHGTWRGPQVATRGFLWEWGGGEVPEEKATPIRMQNAWGPRHLKAVRRLWLAGRDASGTKWKRLGFLESWPTKNVVLTA